MLTTLALFGVLTQPVWAVSQGPPRTVSELARDCERAATLTSAAKSSDVTEHGRTSRGIAEQLGHEAEQSLPQTADRFLDLARCEFIRSRYRAAEAALVKARGLLLRDTGSASTGESNAPPRSIIRQVAPEYPAALKASGVHGIVVVRVEIDPAGHVTAAEIVGSVPEFDAQALAAARNLRFAPVAADGASSTATLTIPMRFDWNAVKQPTEFIDLSRVFAMRHEALASLSVLDQAIAAVRHDASVSEEFAKRYPSAVRDDDADVTMPGVRRSAGPAYTYAAMQRKVQGTVTLEALIDVDGSVTSTSVVRALDPDLDREAVRAVRQWRFTPATKAGVPVPIIVTMGMDFKLH